MREGVGGRGEGYRICEYEHTCASYGSQHFHEPLPCFVLMAPQSSNSLIQSEDFPRYAKIVKEELVAGTSDGRPALERHAEEVSEAVKRCATTQKCVIIDAATASGKSKVVPDTAYEAMKTVNPELKLLVVTTSSVDVMSMQKSTRNRSCWRSGNDLSGGEKWNDSTIVFTTFGLAVRWYGDRGKYWLDEYGGILFDEMDQMEKNPEYASLWEFARIEKQRRPFALIGASATLSKEMQERVNQQGAEWIRCRERPFPVESYTIEILAEEDRF